MKPRFAIWACKEYDYRRICHFRRKNAPTIVRKFLKIKFKPEQDDGKKILQIGCIDNLVRFFKRWIHFADSSDKEQKCPLNGK